MPRPRRPASPYTLDAVASAVEDGVARVMGDEPVSVTGCPLGGPAIADAY
jgi:hypothetical protein